MIELELTPPRPYRLADAVGGRDPTRRSGGGVLELALRTAAGPARARVWQRLDGTLGVRLTAYDAEAALDRLRFVLSADVDHTPFLAMAQDDQLLAPLVRHRSRPAALALRDLRPGARPRAGRAAHSGRRGRPDRAPGARRDLGTA